MRDSAVRGELLLELRHLRPVVEPARVEQIGDVGQDGLVQRPAARAEVYEGDGHA